VIDVVNTTDCVHHRLRVSHITNVELQLGAVVPLAHIVLLLFIAAQDANLAQIRIQKPAQYSVTERTGTPGD
jgi:hypothetical protein